MKFSIMTEPHLGGTYDQQLEVARWAEAEGLVSFARCDHYLSGDDPTPDATDAFAVLAGLARDTTDIRLCVLVSPVTFRHPAVIAKNAVTIDQMSGGRFDLGVGTGWMELEHVNLGLPFPDWKERWIRFEDALNSLAAALAMVTQVTKASSTVSTPTSSPSQPVCGLFSAAAAPSAHQNSLVPEPMSTTSSSALPSRPRPRSK